MSMLFICTFQVKMLNCSLSGVFGLAEQLCNWNEENALIIKQPLSKNKKNMGYNLKYIWLFYKEMGFKICHIF